MKNFPWTPVLAAMIHLGALALLSIFLLLPGGWKMWFWVWVGTAVLIQLWTAFDFGYQHQANRGPKPKSEGWRATRFVKHWLTSLGWPLYFPLDLAMNLGRTAGIVTVWWRQRKAP